MLLVGLRLKQVSHPPARFGCAAWLVSRVERRKVWRLRSGLRLHRRAGTAYKIGHTASN